MISSTRIHTSYMKTTKFFQNKSIKEAVTTRGSFPAESTLSQHFWGPSWNLTSHVFTKKIRRKRNREDSWESKGCPTYLFPCKIATSSRPKISRDRPNRWWFSATKFQESQSSRWYSRPWQTQTWGFWVGVFQRKVGRSYFFGGGFMMRDLEHKIFESPNSPGLDWRGNL